MLFVWLSYVLIHVVFLEQLMYDLMYLKRAYPTCFMQIRLLICYLAAKSVE